MAYDHERGHLEKVHAVLSTVVYPLQLAVNAPYAVAGWATDTLDTHASLVRKNAELRQLVLLDSMRLQKFAALEQANKHLRSLLQASARVTGRVVMARLLATDMDPFRHRVVIDQGAHDGVQPGQVVLGAHGVIGQVIRVGPFSSEAAMITDPSQAIQVQINRTGLRTLAIGTGDADVLSLPYLANNTDVKAGDLLVTSGLAGRYPPGYPVATVTAIHRDPANPFASVTARPLAHLDHGHEVLLYFPARPRPKVSVPSRRRTATSGPPPRR